MIRHITFLGVLLIAISVITLGCHQGKNTGNSPGIMNTDTSKYNTNGGTGPAEDNSNNTTPDTSNRRINNTGTGS